jgi:flavorubredoxin
VFFCPPLFPADKNLYLAGRSSFQNDAKFRIRKLSEPRIDKEKIRDMIARQIKPGIQSLVAIDWDRKLFDQLVPLPEGTTYNAYLVRGSEKTALVDTVYPPCTAELVALLKKQGLTRLDYIVSNHAEQDHSGSIPALLELYPEAKVVTNAKAKGLIAESLLVTEDKFIEVKDGDTLSLGDKTLQFLLMPWVHWPDTMSTYVVEDRILFTCDFFGSHLASSSLYAHDEPAVELAASRYYAEIMMPFRVHIVKHLKRLAPLAIDYIAPSHGPVYDRPAFILDLYRRWVSGAPRPEVVIPYVSMYDSTTTMVNYLIDRLMEKGLTVKPHNMVEADMGKFAHTLVEASTVVFATPAVLAGPHPDIVTAAYLMNALRPKTKLVSVIGSFGWGGDIVSKKIVELLGGLQKQIQFLDPVLVKGLPKSKDFQALDALVEQIFQANQEFTKQKTAR